MPCEKHLPHKKGNCIACGQCKLCAAPRGCNEKKNHNTNVKRGRPTLTKTTKLKNKFKRKKAIRESRATTNEKLNIAASELSSDSDSTTTIDAIHNPIESSTLLLDALTPINNSIQSANSTEERLATVDLLAKNQAFPTKHKLVKLMVLLGIPPLDENIDRFPKNGYVKESFVDPSSRFCRHARRFRSSIIQKIDALLCPNNIEVFATLADPYSNMQKTLENKLQSNVIKLAMYSEKYSSLIASSILAITFNKYELKRFFNDAFLFDNNVPKSRYIVGKKRFHTLRKTFKSLAAGNDLPDKRDYSYRVDPTRIHSALSFLQTSLQVRPGAIRSISFDGYKFNGLPVYTRGGVSVKNLHEIYCKSLGGQNTLGNKTFRAYTKLLTTRGVEKTGLSTYYVRLKYVSSVYLSMLERLQAITVISERPGLFFGDNPMEWTIKNDCCLLTEKWNDTMQFLSFQFSEANLKIDNTYCSVLCCRFGVNATPTCNHIHETRQCKESISALSCTNAFNTLLTAIDIEGNNHVGIDDEILYEVRSMKKTTPIIQSQVKNYMSHRMRAKIQFSAINKIYKELTIDENALLVFDHKQKVLPRQFREGQVDYFGKRGMSLIGAMFVRRIEKERKGEMIIGLEYQFIDCIMQSYSSQDSMQVMSCIQTVIENIKTRYPTIKKLTLQSDNASCYASHDNIPYVYHLNKEFETKNKDIRVDRWVYTEAQTGKGKLDTHFSFVNTLFESYVEDGNDILTENDIYNSLTFQNGIMGTTAILIDGSLLSSNNKIIIGKSFKAKKTGVRETHDIKWVKNDERTFVEIYTLSDVTLPETINADVLDKHQKHDLIMSVLASFTSPKEAMFVPDSSTIKNINNEQNVQLKKGSKAAAVVTGLEEVGIEYNLQNENVTIEKVADLSHNVYPGWASYPKAKKGEALSVATLQELKKLYDDGVRDKSKKVSADRAHVIVTEQTAARDWYERIICTVARVKVFFSLQPNKMIDLIEKSKKNEQTEIIETNQTQQLLELAAAAVDANTNMEGIHTSPIINRHLHEETTTFVIDNIINDDVNNFSATMRINLDQILDENNEMKENVDEEYRELEETEIEMLHELLTESDVD